MEDLTNLFGKTSLDSDDLNILISNHERLIELQNIGPPFNLDFFSKLQDLNKIYKENITFFLSIPSERLVYDLLNNCLATDFRTKPHEFLYLMLELTTAILNHLGILKDEEN